MDRAFAVISESETVGKRRVDVFSSHLIALDRDCCAHCFTSISFRRRQPIQRSNFVWKIVRNHGDVIPRRSQVRAQPTIERRSRPCHVESLRVSMNVFELLKTAMRMKGSSRKFFLVPFGSRISSPLRPQDPRSRDRIYSIKLTYDRMDYDFDVPDSPPKKNWLRGEERVHQKCRLVLSLLESSPKKRYPT